MYDFAAFINFDQDTNADLYTIFSLFGPHFDPSAVWEDLHLFID